MSLSSDLISQFVKATKDTPKQTTKESTVYGTTVVHDDRVWVQIDGSDQLTPITTTTDVQDGERVTVMIKDHSATITGNVSSPSARTGDVKEIGDTLSQFEIVLADKVSTDQLTAVNASIELLQAEDVKIAGTLDANQAAIDDLTAKNVTIEETLTAQKAQIDSLETTTLKADVAEFTYATIENLEVVNEKVVNLDTVYGEFEELTAKNFEAVNADIKNLDASKLSAEQADLRYANVDFSNIGEAAVEKLFTESGIIKDLIMSDGTVTGELVGVTIKGDLIEAGTLKADRLVVLGSDGNYYALSTDFEGMPGVEPVEEDAIHGSVLVANSITAEKISVDDLVAFGATIGGFTITKDSLYSGVKSSADNTTQGIYMDNEGQIAIGDESNYVKYYKDGDSYKLAVSSVDKLEVGGRNLLLGSDISVSNADYPMASFVMSEQMVSGQEYTCRLWGSLGEGKTRFSLYLDGADIALGDLVDNGDGSHQLTFIAPESTLDPSEIYIYPKDESVSVTCSIDKLKLERGSKATDWTPAPEDVDQNIVNAKDDVMITVLEQSASIINECDKIVLSALESYVKTSDYDEYKGSVQSQLEVLSDNINMTFNRTETLASDVDSQGEKFTELEKYIRFSEDGIEISANSSAMTLRLDNDMIIFEKNGTPFGWWDGDDFHTGNIMIELTQRAQFGNFAYVPRDDGSLSFYKVAHNTGFYSRLTSGTLSIYGAYPTLDGTTMTISDITAELSDTTLILGGE